MCEAYPKTGSNTRLVIRITAITVISLCFAYIFCETAVNHPKYYELLLISEELISLAKSVVGVGFLGIVLVGTAEGKDASRSN